MTIAQNMVTWARARIGQTVGAGECWDLANAALVAAGAHGSEHFGTIGPDIDYIWGTVVALNAVEAGDIIQTRDHVVRVTTVVTTRYPDDSEGFDERFVELGRPHHTAIVTSLLDANGTFATLEQNVDPGGRVVQTQRLNSRSIPVVTTARAGRAIDPRNGRDGPVTITTEATVTVTGAIWAYRPVAR